MTQLDVIVNPQNFEVFFAHVTGEDPVLTQQIEARLSDGLPFDPEEMARLYNEFFARVRLQAHMAATGERMARELNNVVAALQTTGDKTGAFANALQHASSSLQTGSDAKSLREMIAGLAAATIDMAEHNRQLTRKLTEASAEMDELRRILKEARTQALTDSLTGLANRKRFDEALAARIEEANARGTPLSLMLCDIDHFKRFNDTWGHQTGDQVLRFIGSVLPKLARDTYLCARYGGEEFAVVMPQTTVAQARTFAETCRATIEVKKLKRRSTQDDLGRITISAGVAQWRRGETADGLIRRADACLYASKRAGRNQVTVDAAVDALSAA